MQFAAFRSTSRSGFCPKSSAELACQWHFYFRSNLDKSMAYVVVYSSLSCYTVACLSGSTSGRHRSVTTPHRSATTLHPATTLRPSTTPPHPATTTKRRPVATEPHSVFVFVNSTEIVYRNVTIFHVRTVLWSPAAIVGYVVAGFLFLILLVVLSVYFSSTYRVVRRTRLNSSLNSTESSQDVYNLQWVANQSSLPMIRESSV